MTQGEGGEEGGEEQCKRRHSGAWDWQAAHLWTRPGKQGMTGVQYGVWLTSYNYTEVTWETGQGGAAVGVSVSSNKDLKPCCSYHYV